jgi:hypothetical protein
MTLRPLLGRKALVMGILPGVTLLGLLGYAIVRAMPR